MELVDRITVENKFPILDTIEEAVEVSCATNAVIAKRHCTCVVALSDNKFSVWPESTATVAGIEPLKIFDKTGVDKEEPDMPMSDEPTIELSEKDFEAHRLLLLAIGCLLLRSDNEKLEFSTKEIEVMEKSNRGLQLNAGPKGIFITRKELSS